MAKLAQEITTEFLTCKICLDEYKNPKCLNCLHTFCEVCIENHVMSESTYKKYSDYREFTCPLCRKRTTLPMGGVKKLPDNFLVSSLGEAIGRQRPSKYPFCDICKLVTHKHKDATSKCLDCNKLLCKACVEIHRDTKVTKNHNVFDVETEKDIQCKEHPEEVVRFYCEPCETCICVLCTFNEHKDHDIASFSDSVTKYKANIENLLRSCKQKIEDSNAQMEQLERVSKIIKTTEERIHEVAIETISQVRQREKGLCEEIHNIYGTELMNLLSNKNELESNLDGLKSACSLTEIVLQGKDIELLLLRKQVHDKLSLLSNIDIADVPETVNKEVKYFHGSVDMGYIQDLSRPMLTRYRTPRTSLPNLSDVDMVVLKEPPEMKESEMQTDIVEEEEESESEDETVEGVEVGVQCSPDPVDVSTQGTETEQVDTDEKGVNTRSRSTSDAANQDDVPQSPSAQRRIRRRRERAKTTDITQEEASEASSSYAADDSSTRQSTYGGSSYRRQSEDPGYNRHSDDTHSYRRASEDVSQQSTYEPGRYRRSRFLYGGMSMDPYM